MILIAYYEKECWVINNCINFVLHALDKLQIPYDLTHGNDVYAASLQKKYTLALAIHPTSQIIPDLPKYQRIECPTIWWDFEAPYEIDTIRQGIDYFDFVYTFCGNSAVNMNNPKVMKLPTATDNTVYKPIEVGNEYKCDTVFIGNAFPSRIEYFRMIKGMKYKSDLTIIGVGYPEDIKKRYTVIDKIISPEECNKWYNGAKDIIEMQRTMEDCDLGQNKEKILPHLIPMRHWDIKASKGNDVGIHTFEYLVKHYIKPLL